jgi:hypothetical protein
MRPPPHLSMAHHCRGPRNPLMYILLATVSSSFEGNKREAFRVEGDAISMAIIASMSYIHILSRWCNFWSRIGITMARSTPYITGWRQATNSLFSSIDGCTVFEDRLSPFFRLFSLFRTITNPAALWQPLVGKRINRHKAHLTVGLL